MAKNWYPVIDYAICIDCGGCLNQCKKGVYNKDKYPSPVVINPINYSDHCHGCGTVCPIGAITYVGEDTDWTPPNGKSTNGKNCGCGSSGCS